MDPGGQAGREAGGPAELLLLEKGNHGCANLAPFHRYLTADWVAERLGTTTTRRAARGPRVSGQAHPAGIAH